MKNLKREPPGWLTRGVFRGWTPFFLSSIFMLFLARYRMLSRTAGIEMHFSSPFFSIAEDILVIGGLGLLASGTFQKWGMRFLSLVTALSLFGILFQTRMMQPLTRGLIGQIGGVFDMTASFESSDMVRNYVLVIAVILFFYATWVLLSWVQRKMPEAIQKGIQRASLLLFVSSPILMALTPTSLDLLSKNSLLLLIKTPDGSERLLKSAAFSGMTPVPLPRITPTREPAQNGVQKKWNIVFFLMETFNYSLIQNEENWKTIMPHLYGMRHRFTLYRNHYTPWPLSSKAIFSVVCGDYPHPSNFIEIRLFPERPCDSWIPELVRAGYSTWSGYSGALTFDRLGKFLAAHGIQTIEDKHDFRKLGTYKEISWGLDDKAMLDGFEKWVSGTKEPFFSFLIPNNSHHPYWTPHPEYEKFETAYKNSYHYQDQLIQKIMDFLESRKLLENTIVIITGDHGARFETAFIPGTLPEEPFHVPLWVYFPWKKDQKTMREFHHPTSHIDLGGSILQWTGVGGNYLRGHLLSENKTVYVFGDFGRETFLLIDGKKTWLFDSKSEKVFRSEGWLTELKDECPATECQEQKQVFMNILSHSVKEFPELMGSAL